MLAGTRVAMRYVLPNLSARQVESEQRGICLDDREAEPRGQCVPRLEPGNES